MFWTFGYHLGNIRLALCLCLIYATVQTFAQQQSVGGKLFKLSSTVEPVDGQLRNTEEPSGRITLEVNETTDGSTIDPYQTTVEEPEPSSSDTPEVSDPSETDPTTTSEISPSTEVSPLQPDKTKESPSGDLSTDTKPDTRSLRFIVDPAGPSNTTPTFETWGVLLVIVAGFIFILNILIGFCLVNLYHGLMIQREGKKQLHDYFDELHNERISSTANNKNYRGIGKEIRAGKYLPKAYVGYDPKRRITPIQSHPPTGTPQRQKYRCDHRADGELSMRLRERWWPLHSLPTLTYQRTKRVYESK